VREEQLDPHASAPDQPRLGIPQIYQHANWPSAIYASLGTELA